VCAELFFIVNRDLGSWLCDLIATITAVKAKLSMIFENVSGIHVGSVIVSRKKIGGHLSVAKPSRCRVCCRRRRPGELARYSPPRKQWS
jgi:hypothetical protein